MNAQTTPATDEEIWEELLNSEASRKFLAEQVRKAEEILNGKLVYVVPSTLPNTSTD